MLFLKDLVPEARCMRSHGLIMSSNWLLASSKEYNIQFDFSCFLPYAKCIEPHVFFYKDMSIIRLPYNWEDDVHFMYKNDFSNFGLDLVKKCLNVFDFHPIHVFLNTDTESTYINAKEYYHNPDQLVKCRNTTNTGTRDALIRLLKKINSDKLSHATLLEFYLNAK